MVRHALDDRTRIAPPVVRLVFWTGIAAITASVTWLWFDASMLQAAKGTTDQLQATASIQVRAYDRGGHPVAGADVTYQGKKVGITDSFGEMRRLMRVPLGGSMTFSLTKDSKSTRHTGERQITVPSEMPREGDMEIHASVVMDTRPLKPETASTEAIQATAEIADESDLQTESINMSAQLFEKVSITAATSEGAFRETDRARSRQLKTAILPIVQREAEQLGLRLDQNANWKIQLRDLPVIPDESDVVGLVEVTSENTAAPKVASFTYVVPYEKSNVSAARAILAPLAAHIARPYSAERKGDRWFVRRPAKNNSAFWSVSPGSTLVDPAGRAFRLASGFNSDGLALLSTENDMPCSARPAHVKTPCMMSTRPAPANSPAEGWRHFKFHITGKTPKAIRVYAGVYRATANDKGEWTYWAPATMLQPTTLTFVQDEQITNRLIVRNNPTRAIAINAQMIKPKIAHR